MKLRTRNVISSSSLHADSCSSQWYQIYQTRDVGTFISTVSIDPDSFDYLLEEFSKHYIVGSFGGRGGRPPRLLHKHAVLGCLLHYYSAPMEYKTLSELFSIVPSTLSRTLKKAEYAMAETLKNIPEARIVFPSKAKQRRWAKITQKMEPIVRGVFAWADGKNLRVQEPSDIDLQNALYNGRSNLYVLSDVDHIPLSHHSAE